MKISKQDQKFLAIIRKSVSSFILELSKQYDQKGKLLLDIAPQDYEGAKAFFKNCEIKSLDINPDSNANYILDICNNNREIIPDKTLDYILCTEVLEHTLNPFKAVDEMYRILKPKGLLFISVPFNFRIHGPLPDCWRFTKYGIESLLKIFKILKIEEIPTLKRNLMPIHYRVIAQK